MKNQIKLKISDWMRRAHLLPHHQTFAKELKVDVCVVGAGIAGLTTAYMLMLEGKSVAIMDEAPMGSETERTPDQPADSLEDRCYRPDVFTSFPHGSAPDDFKLHLPVRSRQLHGCWLERLHGEKGSRLAAESHTAAINWIETIVTDERIDCDFERVDGYLFAPPGSSSDILDRELDAAHRAGLTKVQRLSRAPLDSFDTGPCLRFPQQAQFHPRRFLNGLAQVIQHNGGKMFSSTEATKIEGGSLAWVETKEGRIVMADAVIIATNRSVNERAAIQAHLAPHRTYVIGAKVPSGSAPRALYWDTGDPCHYVRVHRILVGKWSEEAYDLLLVGGEDHPVGQADDSEKRWARLEKWARQRFPMISGVACRWSGQVSEPIDGLAFIGPNPMHKPNVYLAAGNPVSGMTLGPIAGRLLTDLICGRENEWAGLYDPRRITSSAAATSTIWGN